MKQLPEEPATGYRPQPIDIAEHDLPPELKRLSERLAEHVHDTWAVGRLNDGWRYGPNRDDSELTHPGLVAYEQLSDKEKDYDRRTAEGTLRAILALGYQIVPPMDADPVGENLTPEPTP